MKLTMKRLFCCGTTLTVLTLGSILATAQTTNAPPAPAAPPTQPTGTATSPSPAANAPVTGTMQTIVITAPTAPVNTVLPTTAPVSSVFGTDMDVQDTPRTVTVLTPEILQAYDVRSLQDLSKTAPSAYQTDQFGGYSVPNIRGQDAEVFINGQQRTTRSDGPPTSFNSIESAQIVAGPASSVYGPTGYTGGYVNFVTKTPYFDAWHSTSNFTYGSYDTKRWQEDFGAPIIPDLLAFRASYEGEDSGSYYENAETKSQDGFFALAYTPNKDFRIDFNTEFQDVRFDEITGWNRPTQDLIDSHTYTTGAGGFFSPIVPTGGTRLSDSTELVSPADSDYAKDYNAQLTLTYNVNDNVTIINRSYYEYEYLRNTELAQYYSNLITSNNAQDRLEIHINFDTPMGDAPAKTDPKDEKDMKQEAAITAPLDFKHEIVTGVAFKAIQLQDYQGFFNEFLNATDLSTNTFPLVGNGAPGSGSTFNTLPLSGSNLYFNPGGNYGTGFVQPGTEAESAYVASAFFQHNITFTPQWSLLYGTRADLIFDELHDPLPDTGNEPAHDNTVQFLPSANISLNYKPASWLTAYMTYSYSQSAPGNTGGGYSIMTGDNNLSGGAFHQGSELYEGGLKADLLDHTFFTTADAYYQTHGAVTSLGGVATVRTFGSELQQTWQPDKHFYLSLNESWLDATVVDPTAEFTEKNSDIFGLTGNGTPNFITPPAGHYREGGLPRFLLNGIASYTLDCGLGASLSYQITDPIPVSEVDPIWIPWQYQIDASLFYIQKNWEARLNLFNITDQHNFSTGGFIAGTGNDLITIGEPFHMEGTLTYKF
jgi:outer membrane receptor for monomeric catechols